MTDSKNSRRGKRGSNHVTRDLVGKGGAYESKTPENKVIARRRRRRRENAEADTQSVDES